MKPVAWIKIVTGILVLLLAGSGGVWWLGVREGQAREHRKAYETERRARIDSIRVADLVKDSTARELREASRVLDSSAAAQKAKRAAITITGPTSIMVIGDTTTYAVPPILVSYLRGADAKVAVDARWTVAVGADTLAIASQRDLWKRRALAAEGQLARERHRFGLKAGIAIGVTTTLAIAKAVAEIVR